MFTCWYHEDSILSFAPISLFTAMTQKSNYTCLSCFIDVYRDRQYISMTIIGIPHILQLSLLF